MLRTLTIAALFVVTAFGQSLLDLRTQTKSVDFSGATSTKPVQTGTALPTNCTTGQMYFNAAATAGQNLYGCTGSGTWVPESGASGIAGVSVLSGMVTVGSRPTLNFSAGPGTVLTVSDTGQAISIQPGADLSILQTRSSAQAGSALFCDSSSGSTSIYSCSLSPSLTGYVTGMMLNWRPDLSGSGGATTLNIDTLGPRAIKLADGITDPAAGNIPAGEIQEIWYDGSVFRILQPASTGGGGITVQSGGTLIGTRSTLNFSSALGSLLSISDTGQAISIQPGADLAVMQTRAGEQAGAGVFCASSSGSGTNYTCGLSPSLTAYVKGMVLRWLPDVNGSGGPATLNIDTLGTVSIKLADGATDPAPGDIVANRIQQIWYDGSVFRAVQSLTPAGTAGESMPACAQATRGRFWFAPGNTGVKDSLSVCAKDAGNSYSWRSLY